MKKNVLIVGAGGVAHVAAHKCAQNNDVLGDICIASRTQKKCDAIIESVKRKNNIKDKKKKLLRAGYQPNRQRDIKLSERRDTKYMLSTMKLRHI